MSAETDQTTKPVTIYRLRLAMGSATSGWGDWTLYEDREEFEHRVLLALIEAGARDRDGRRGDRGRWVLRGWLTALGVEDKKVGVERLVAAEELIDGQWVDLRPSLIPPSVVFAEAAS